MKICEKKVSESVWYGRRWEYKSAGSQAKSCYTQASRRPILTKMFSTEGRVDSQIFFLAD